MEGNILLAFGLTTLAGLSTGIGSAIVFFAKKTNTKFLALSLGFSAGVMIYVSMVELFAESQSILQGIMGDRKGMAIVLLSFFGGMLLIAIIDRMVPHDENPHEFEYSEEVHRLQCGDMKLCSEPVQAKESTEGLMRTGILTAMAIAIHNFPEGIATFVAALHDPVIALPIVVAIALHNIPEGIAVSVPVFYATGDRKKAFFYSFASGLAEPLGALVGFLILMPFLNDMMYGIIFAGIAGIMVFISFDELLPAAREYGEHHLSIYGLVAGMVVMSVSLLLFL